LPLLRATPITLTFSCLQKAFELTFCCAVPVVAGACFVQIWSHSELTLT
jgi:hypothetical protein